MGQMIFVDLTGIFRSELRRRGALDLNSLLENHPKLKQKVDLDLNDEQLIITHGSFNFTLPRKAEISSKYIEDQLTQRLHAVLDKIKEWHKHLNPRSIKIIFQAGGSLKLPEWFLAGLKELGVEILFLDDLNSALNQAAALIPDEPRLEPDPAELMNS